MKSKQVTGLGEPELIGKKSLFQPAEDEGMDTHNRQASETSRDQPMPRVRTTIGLTNKALATIQEIQNHHRLHTGKVLPLWKIVSEAIECYGRSKRGDGKHEYPQKPDDH